MTATHQIPAPNDAAVDGVDGVVPYSRVPAQRRVQVVVHVVREQLDDRGHGRHVQRIDQSRTMWGHNHAVTGEQVKLLLERRRERLDKPAQ